MIEPTAEQRADIARYYKMLLEKAAEVRIKDGPESQGYAVAVCVLSATASAIQVAFKFEKTSDAHRWLRGIALAA